MQNIMQNIKIIKNRLFSSYALAFLATFTVLSTGFSKAFLNTKDSDWKNIVDKVSNAVVQIHSQYSGFNWKEPYKPLDSQEGYGTGFFISSEGYILTNYHVIENAKTLQFFLPGLGKQALNAFVVGACPESDVALLKVSDQDIDFIKNSFGKVNYIESGDSDLLYPTEEVLALGYPLGQRYLKSTTGVVAGKEYLNGSSYMHITAPINPGNSGGPLLNKKGEWVGVNTAIITGANSIGYMIASNEIKILLENLKTVKLLHKPRLGVYCNTTTDEHALSLKAPLPSGFFVNNVTKGSAADLSNIKPNDIIYKINGYKVDKFGDVSVNFKSISKLSLGEFLIRFPLKSKLSILLYRDGKQITVNCTLDNKLNHIRTIYPDFEHNLIDYEMFGGICVMQLRANHFNILPYSSSLQLYSLEKNEDEQVLVITKILPGSYIHKINCFYEGDILDQVNNTKVCTIKDLRDALKLSKKTGTVTVSVKNKRSTVMSLKDILKDETRLSRDFKFSISNTVNFLNKSK